MKTERATGLNKIPSELLKLIHNDNIKLLKKQCNIIHVTGIIPPEWLYNDS